MGKFIYAYRLTYDTGNAPCVDDGLFSLACCKGGQIWKNGKEVHTGLRNTIGKRHKRDIDEGIDEVYVMGIYDKNKFLYFAKIDKVITMSDYFVSNSEYSNRCDCIYTLKDGELVRNGKNKEFHSLKDSFLHKKDKLGNYVLLSKSFAYWGNKCQIIDKTVLDFMPKGVGHKIYAGDSEEYKKIFKLANEYGYLSNKSITNLPNDSWNVIDDKKGCGK